MTRAEQETILRWSADDDVVSIFTAHPPTKRKLERSNYKPWKVSTERGVEAGWFFRVPIAELRWRVGAKRRTGRTLTDAQRQAAGARLNKARAQHAEAAR